MNSGILKGKKIAITAYDLQQKEHRGIAQYTKNLIKVLHENGAEIYLITNIGSKRIRRNKNKSFFEEVCISDISHKFSRNSFGTPKKTIPPKPKSNPNHPTGLIKLPKIALAKIATNKGWESISTEPKPAPVLEIPYVKKN